MNNWPKIQHLFLTFVKTNVFIYHQEQKLIEPRAKIKWRTHILPSQASAVKVDREQFSLANLALDSSNIPLPFIHGN